MRGAGRDINQVDSPGQLGSTRTPQAGSGDVGQLPGQHVLRVVVLPREACGEDAEPRVSSGVEPKPSFSVRRGRVPSR